MTSIRRFLYGSLSMLVAGAALLTGAATYLIAYHEVNELFDAQLAQNARLIGLLTSSENFRLDPTIIHDGRFHARFEHDVAVQRWSAEGQLLLASASVPQKPLAEFREGLSTREIDDNVWHVFTQHMPDGVWLMVAEKGDMRDELARGAALAVAVPYVMAVPVILLLVTLAVRRGMKPLGALTSALRRRDDRNLQPLRTDAAQVDELLPLEKALNQLLLQLQHALEREQRFTADAAHELRTLLAVLKLHADNARTLSDPDEVQASLVALQAGVDRATRMVAQLLALARVDHAADAALSAPTTVMPVIRQVLADLTPMAERRGQSLQIDGDSSNGWRVPLRAEALDILFRNLVENALRYSPAGGSVTVRAEVKGDCIRILVEDDGEGIPPNLAQRVRERFFRVANDGEGAGLGLSISSRILDLAGGSLDFIPRQRDSRACAVVSLPLA